MLTGTSLNQLKLIAAEAEKATIPIYIVGGLVRDLLNHSLENSFDLDLMIESEPESFAHKIANILCGTAEKITPFLTVKIRIQNSADGFREIDIAQARSEIYRHPGALPEVQAARLTDDLKRRDFSVNAMALPLRSFIDYLSGKEGEALCNIYDFFNGRTDIENKIIRVLHNSSFIDDPTRLFRACRYKVRLHAQYDKQTSDLMVAAVSANALETVSYQRKINEIKKICQEREIARIFKELSDFKILDQLELVARENIEKFIDVLNNTEFIEGDNFRTVLEIVYSLASVDQRQGFIAHYNLGKKFIAEIANKVGE